MPAIRNPPPKASSREIAGLCEIAVANLSRISPSAPALQGEIEFGPFPLEVRLYFVCGPGHPVGSFVLSTVLSAGRTACRPRRPARKAMVAIKAAAAAIQSAAAHGGMSRRSAEKTASNTKKPLSTPAPRPTATSRPAARARTSCSRTSDWASLISKRRMSWTLLAISTRTSLTERPPRINGPCTRGV